jgi:hypothetical protein
VTVGEVQDDPIHQVPYTVLGAERADAANVALGWD